MITLHDIFLGEVTLNPLHINFMRKNYSKKRQIRDAQTFLIYYPPDQNAVQYYLKESIADIITHPNTTGSRTNP